MSPGQTHLFVPVFVCVRVCARACVHVQHAFFLKRCLSEYCGIPHAFPHPLQIDSEGDTFHGFGTDPWGWGVCSVLVGMSQGLYEITRPKNTVIYLCVLPTGSFPLSFVAGLLAALHSCAAATLFFPYIFRCMCMFLSVCMSVCLWVLLSSLHVPLFLVVCLAYSLLLVYHRLTLISFLPSFIHSFKRSLFQVFFWLKWSLHWANSRRPPSFRLHDTSIRGWGWILSAIILTQMFTSIHSICHSPLFCTDAPYKILCGNRGLYNFSQDFLHTVTYLLFT